jgi:GNAT superfamily N-acetyltransferase
MPAIPALIGRACSPLSARHPSRSNRQDSAQGSVNRGAMTETLHIRRAGADDMSTIIGLINEARSWLPAKSTDQWAAPWPSLAGRDARVLRDLKAARTVLVEDDQHATAASVTCSPTGNRRLWPLDEQAESAVYVARLIVSRSHAGERIGETLVDWAGACALRNWGARWIRIDVWTTNAALHNYYEKRGFQYYDTREFSDGEYYPSAALFQKPTAEIDNESLSRFTWSPAVEPRLDRPASGQPGGLSITQGIVSSSRPTTPL